MSDQDRDLELTTEPTELQSFVAVPAENQLESESVAIEYIIRELGGSFGRFQVFNYVMYSIAMCFCGMTGMAYVLTAMNLDYRCNIAECDSEQPALSYETKWLGNAIPFTDGKLAKCQRYERGTHFTALESGLCDKNAFNTSNVVDCGHDGFIYKTDEITIVNEFNVTCADKEFLVASVGTFNSVGRIVAMPLSGMLSDKLGRRKIVMLSILSSSIAGLVQSFADGYWMFVICEFLNAALLCPAYPAAILLCMEWSDPKQRVITSGMALMSNPIGIALTGVIAAHTRNFRMTLRYVFGSGFVAIAMMFLSSESLRWLFVKGKLDRLESTIASAVKWNGLQVSPKMLEIVRSKCIEIQEAKRFTASDKSKHENQISLFDLFKHKSLIVRFSIISFAWFSITFIVYGVSVFSVSLSLSGDKYLNYIIMGLGGLPASIVVIFLLKYVGRRKSLSTCLLVTATAILSIKFVPSNWSAVALMTFLMARIGIAAAFTLIYIFTSELWPTSARHTMMGLSSTLGRIGSSMSPLTPLLANFSDILPFVLFGSMAITTAVVIQFVPETFNCKLADTVDETLHLGKKPKKSSKRCLKCKN